MSSFYEQIVYNNQLDVYDGRVYWKRENIGKGILPGLNATVTSINEFIDEWLRARTKYSVKISDVRSFETFVTKLEKKYTRQDTQFSMTLELCTNELLKSAELLHNAVKHLTDYILKPGSEAKFSLGRHLNYENGKDFSQDFQGVIKHFQPNSFLESINDRTKTSSCIIQNLDERVVQQKASTYTHVPNNVREVEGCAAHNLRITVPNNAMEAEEIAASELTSAVPNNAGEAETIVASERTSVVQNYVVETLTNAINILTNAVLNNVEKEEVIATKEPIIAVPNNAREMEVVPANEPTFSVQCKLPKLEYQSEEQQDGFGNNKRIKRKRDTFLTSTKKPSSPYSKKCITKKS